MAQYRIPKFDVDNTSMEVAGPSLATLRRELQDLFRMNLDLDGPADPKSPVTMACFLRLLDKAKELKGRTDSLTKQTNFAERKARDAEAEVTELKQRLSQVTEETDRKRKAEAKKAEELGGEVKRLQQKLRQQENAIKQLQNERQEQNTRKLEAELRDKFVVAVKPEKTLTAEVTNRLDFENKQLQKHVEILTANLAALFDLSKEVNNGLWKAQQLRKDFLKMHYKPAEGRETSLREIERMPTAKIDFFDPKLDETLQKNVAIFFQFLEQFEGLLSEHFRSFLRRRNNVQGKNEPPAYEDVYREKSLAKVKDVLEMNNLLDTYQEMIRSHQKYCTENMADDDVDDLASPYLGGSRGGRAGQSDLDELTAYLVNQGETLKGLRERKAAIDQQIVRDVSEMAQKIQEHL